MQQKKPKIYPANLLANLINTNSVTLAEPIDDVWCKVCGKLDIAVILGVLMTLPVSLRLTIREHDNSLYIGARKIKMEGHTDYNFRAFDDRFPRNDA